MHLEYLLDVGTTKISDQHQETRVVAQDAFGLGHSLNVIDLSQQRDFLPSAKVWLES